jgi:acyl carrier protein
MQQSQVTATASENVNQTAPTLEEIQEWLIAYVADLLELEPDEIDLEISFDRYGLDSSATLGLMADLEDWLGCKLNPTLLYNYPNIGKLSQYLDSLLQKKTGT